MPQSGRRFLGHSRPAPDIRRRGSDSNGALIALTRGAELLITRVAFPSGTHGIALALMAKRSRPGIKIVFAARPEFREQARGLGEFIAMPVNIAELVATVKRLIG